MASTKNGIIYPDNYDKVADVPADMKVLAESVDGNIERINKNLDKNADKLKNLQKDNTGNKTAIEANQNNIKALQVENAEVKAENERLRSDIGCISLIGQAEGESIDLDDSSGARFRKFGIGGNHKQETREGYNLLDFNVTQDGRVTVNKDGTITINGTGGFLIKFKEVEYKKGVTYKAKATLVSGTYTSSDPNHIGIMTPHEDYEWLANNIFKTYTFLQDKVRSEIWVGEACVFNNATFEIYCYEGTDDKNFEQYGASPSPDYPSEIKTVKDSVEIKVVNNDNTQEQTITMPVQQEMLEGDYISNVEHHGIGIYVFTGEETVTISGSRFQVTYYKIAKGKTAQPSLCNISTYANWALTGKHFNVSNSDCYFTMDNFDFSTAEEMKAYLKAQYEAGTPIKICYPLVTPIDLELTSEQKAVAKQIKETLHTYKNVTHIYSDDEISPIVNVEYAKDLNTTISNIQALVLNNASEEVSG